MQIFDIETRPNLPSKLPFFPGNKGTKDEAKIKAQQEEKRKKYIDNAALNAETASVCAFGCYDTHTEQYVDAMGDNEVRILEFALEQLNKGDICGFNSRRFDVPMLVRRAWICGVTVPTWIADRAGGYTAHIDLMEQWQVGDRQLYIGLDRLCELMGIEGKKGSGKDFHEWLDKGETEKAKEYLEQDVMITVEIARRMGIA